MKRRLVLSVVAAAAAGSLLSSCSGGKSEPAGAAAGVQSPVPSEDDERGDVGELEDDAENASGSPGGDIDRPEIVVPDDLEKEFEPVDTDDPDELAVLADQEQYFWAVDEAITSGDSERPALSFYADDIAHLNALQYVGTFHEDGYTVGGSIRYYNRTVTLRDEGVATTSTCLDYSESHMEELDSGERFPEGDVRALVTTRAERNEADVWQTVSETSTTSEDGACP
ncbi:hypothetical protein [Streptomyces lonarensis]|uniref:Lipoprotein n=1 Tax=Streptomyces lonarensis TaxID=700599 RepID=A0A7X6HX99_9ACTN|nr:hypothetical protein [Streptomyces lonarensis]NJQ04125.1 hypothetical protein [Streptomyces lonarensis]